MHVNMNVLKMIKTGLYLFLVFENEVYPLISKYCTSVVEEVVSSANLGCLTERICMLIPQLLVPTESTWTIIVDQQTIKICVQNKN